MLTTKKQLHMDVKTVAEDGTFEGLLSVYNVVDQTNESVAPGAFTKTINEHGSVIPMLWQHQADNPIGTLTLRDSKDALSVTGKLLLELPEAQKAYLLLKAGIIKGLSIGFRTVKDSIEDGVRVLKECRLFEGSVVTFPALESALITSVKHRRNRPERKDDFNEEFNDQQLQDMGYQMREALFSALSSLIWASGLTSEERVAAAEITIQQFADAYLAYFPKYLDWLTEEYGDDFLTMSAAPLELKNKFKNLLLEGKAGRTISAATYSTLSDAQKCMQKGMDEHKSAMDIIQALIDDGAEDDADPADMQEDPTMKASSHTNGLPAVVLTLEAKAAAAVKEPEPVVHSQAFDLIEMMRSLIPAA